MYKSIYKQTFTHTGVEFDSMHFGAGCLGRMWPYYPKLWQIFSVDFRGIFFYFRYIGVSSYCSHRDHCVHADQQSDQTLSASGISQLKSNEAIVLLTSQNGPKSKRPLVETAPSQNGPKSKRSQVKTAPSQNGPNQNGPKSLPKQSLVKTALSLNSFLVIACIEILLHMFILYITCQILNLRIWT